MKGMSKAETIKAKILLLSEEVRKLTWEYVEEMALDPNTKTIKVHMIPSEDDKIPYWFKEWECDTAIEIGGRMWNISGTVWYGTIFTEVEEKC